jgi:hypothetical protein
MAIRPESGKMPRESGKMPGASVVLAASKQGRSGEQKDLNKSQSLRLQTDVVTLSTFIVLCADFNAFIASVAQGGN